MKRIIQLAASLVLAVSLLTGCGDLNGIHLENKTERQTAVANAISTVKAVMTARAPSPAPATSTPQPAITTPVLEPTLVSTSTPIATLATAYCISNVEDVTVPDGSEFAPGAALVKTWRLTNGGTAFWPADTKLVYVSGDQLAAENVVLGKQVDPGQSIDVTVNLQAPTTEGSYQGFFMLQTSAGKLFGSGPSASNTFWVKITVKEFFQVTRADVNASPASYSGVCPGSISLSVTITASAAGDVTYYFITPAGNSGTYTLSFTQGGTITSAPISWSISGPDALTVSIYIDNPNHQEFPAITIPVTCE